MTRQEQEARQRLARHHREVFGHAPPPDAPPNRATMPPEPVKHAVRPVRLDHDAGCTSERVETLGWDDGRRVARCHDCTAERTVWPSSP